MWTRTYLLLLLLRLYFAFSPSYIHPDENFQGPEVVAGALFNLPHHQTWEFTTDAPVRSLFPLWPVYGLPMLVLKGIWTELGTGDVPPRIIYYTIRILLFTLNFVLEDWAIHELVQSPRHRRLAITFVASSYVTWTYQTHAFSNAIETLAVLWTLVMIQRIMDSKEQSSNLSSAILGVILTFGLFNRVTFPAFVIVPLLWLAPFVLRRPLSLLSLILATLSTAAIAIAVDTYHYTPAARIKDVLLYPVITPLNSLLYNSDSSNLAVHGLHPHYQHLIASLPLLLGPALFLLPTVRSQTLGLPLVSATAGLVLLSLIPHQEARFLLPLVPLYLSSVGLPRSPTLVRTFLALWVLFNLLVGTLMGVYHQGGIIPAQTFLGEQSRLLSQLSPQQHKPSDSSVDTTSAPLLPPMHTVIWWRCYSPPIYLLGHPPQPYPDIPDAASMDSINSTIATVDVMGASYTNLKQRLFTELFAPATSCDATTQRTAVGLVAPLSSLELDQWFSSSTASSNSGSTEKATGDMYSDPRGRNADLRTEEIWRTRRHINLDDIDLFPTSSSSSNNNNNNNNNNNSTQGNILSSAFSEIGRVWGRRGLVLYRISRRCTSGEVRASSIAAKSSLAAAAARASVAAKAAAVAASSEATLSAAAAGDVISGGNSVGGVARAVGGAMDKMKSAAGVAHPAAGTAAGATAAGGGAAGVRTRASSSLAILSRARVSSASTPGKSDGEERGKGYGFLYKPFLGRDW